MSTAVPYVAAPARVRQAGAPAGSWRLQALSILAFEVLAMLAGLRFASLLGHPSFLRVAGIVAVGGVLACALTFSGGAFGRGRLASAAAPAMSVLALAVSLWCAGFGLRELAPWHWGLLVRELGRGIEALNGLWPYSGSSPQARAAVMACIPAAVIPAAALAFPRGGPGAVRRHLGALTLLLALYVTGAVNGGQSGWRLQGLAALAALYLWGWSSRSRRAEDGRAAAWLLAGALAAVLAAGAVAGGPVIDVRSLQPFGQAGADTAFNWNQTYGPLPWPDSNAEMVQVGAGEGHLWRATELDRFDGTRFLASGSPPRESPGLAEEPRNRRWLTSTTVLVRGLSSRLLLSPGEILTVSAAGAALPDLGSIAPDGTLAAASPAAEGTRYTTLAYVPRPSVSEMRAAPAPLPGASEPYVEFDVPSPAGGEVAVSAASAAGVASIEASPYAGVYALARRLAAGATDSYDVAARIEAFLRHGYIYDTNPPASRYPIVTFLLGDRRGYCQQFSAAMALMLRMDGIPARIGAGFLPGTRSTPHGPFLVSAHDAHAWVEVLYPGIGWVTSDPTPEGHAATASDLAAAQSSAGEAAASAGREARRRAAAARAGHPAHGTRAQARRGTGTGSSIPILLGLAAALGLIGAGALTLRRRSAGRRPNGDGELAELTRALGLLGLAPAPGTTLAELEQRLSRSHGAEAGAYLRALRELRYGAPGRARPPTPHERRQLRRALSSGRGPAARLRGLVALPPGRTA